MFRLTLTTTLAIAIAAISSTSAVELGASPTMLRGGRALQTDTEPEVVIDGEEGGDMATDGSRPAGEEGGKRRRRRRCDCSSMTDGDEGVEEAVRRYLQDIEDSAEGTEAGENQCDCTEEGMQGGNGTPEDGDAAAPAVEEPAVDPAVEDPDVEDAVVDGEDTGAEVEEPEA